MNIGKRKFDKRNIFSAVLIGAVLAAGPFLFWRIFLQQLPLTGSGNATISNRFEESERGLSPTPVPPGQARLRELLAYPANSLTVDRSSGMLRMYEEGTGRAFEVSPTTLQVLTLSEEHLDDFLYSSWSPNGREVITLFDEQDGSTYRYFDYGSSRVAELPQNVRMFAFSPNGDRILSARDTSNGIQLWVSAPDGADEWLLMVLRLNVIELFWPQENMFVLITEREDGTEDLIALNMYANIEVLLEKYSDLEVVWAPNGVLALISFMDDEGRLVLDLFSTTTNTLETLPLTTRASKCAWHRGSSNITCGVPSQTTSAGRDTVTSMDLETGKLDVRYQAAQDVFIGLEDPVMLPRGDEIAFINIFDKRPYLISW